MIDKGGKERAIPLREFFLTPEQDVQREHTLKRDDILTTIIVPRLPQQAGSAYMNLKHKQSFDWPLVEAAAVLHLDNGKVRDARVVLGSVAPVPIRSITTEQVLIGNVVNDELATRAGHTATEGAAPLTSNGYKVSLLAELVRRTVLKAAGQLSPAEEVIAL